ncbi:MAG: hypothetical protein AAGJ54_05750 [Planctomycetota bacterium]
MNPRFIEAIRKQTEERRRAGETPIDRCIYHADKILEHAAALHAELKDSGTGYAADTVYGFCQQGVNWARREVNYRAGKNHG